MPKGDPQSEALTAERSVGNAKIHFTGEGNIRVTANVFLIGSAAEIYEGKDVLSLQIGFENFGRDIRRPSTVRFQFTHFSKAGLKFGDHSRLTIFVDKIPLVSGTLKTRFFRPDEGSISRGSHELDVPFNDFLRIAAATDVSFRINETVVVLDQHHLQTLRDIRNVVGSTVDR